MEDNLAHPDNRRQVITIDDLPDDVLLEVFDFYVFKYQYLGSLQFMKRIRKIESWQSLVHVCRRWRCLVFGSPRRLNLQLYCTPRIFARKSLEIWPALPLLIRGSVDIMSVNDVIAGLEHTNRIRQIVLDFHTTLPFEVLWTAMDVPFPELAALDLSYGGWSCDPILPGSFLGGSAPRLRYLYLDSIPFPGLPNLLLSATHLVRLRLFRIPYSGYISPEVMATCLSALTSLEELQLVFNSPFPDFKSRLPFPSTRSVLPTLMDFWFKGLSKYLEEFVARIEAPQLSSTTFFDNIDFNTVGLNQFISRVPTLGAYDEARLVFYTEKSQVRLRQSHPERSDLRVVEVTVLGQEPDRHLSCLAQICTFSLRLPLTTGNLYVYETPYSTLYWMDDIESNDLPDLLLSFTAVKNLYLSELFSRRIARALQELTGGKITEVFPALQNIHLEGFQPSEPVQGGIARFISARLLTNHPVAISIWDRGLLRDQ